MCSRPSARRTYSVKSVEFARRVSPVRWSRTFRPDEPGHEVDAVAAEVGVGHAVAVVERERARGGGDRGLDDVAREQDALAGVVERQAVLEEAPAHLRAADLHPDLGQDPLRLVDDPADQLVAQDVQARPHQALPSRSASAAVLGSVPSAHRSLSKLDHAADCPWRPDSNASRRSA